MCAVWQEPDGAWAGPDLRESQAAVWGDEDESYAGTGQTSPHLINA